MARIKSVGDHLVQTDAVTGGVWPEVTLVDSSGSALVLSSSSAVIASASFTPTASAYSAGDLVDVAKQFAITYAISGAAVPATAVIRWLSTVLRIDQTALQTNETSYQLAMYKVTPPSAQADNAAWTLASADLPSYLGKLDLGTPVDLGAACFIKSQLVDQQDILLSASSIFGELITQGSATFGAATARQVTLLGVVM